MEEECSSSRTRVWATIVKGVDCFKSSRDSWALWAGEKALGERYPFRRAEVDLEWSLVYSTVIRGVDELI